MDGIASFKLALVALLVGFGALMGVAMTTNFLFAMMDIWATLWGRVLVADLFFAFLLFGCWAIYRDGWLKGIAWVLSFFVLGSAAVAVKILWDLRHVREMEDIPMFLLGRQTPPELLGEEEEEELRENDRAPTHPLTAMP